MANTLGVYNPIMYAQEALIQLENAMGMARTVHRGFEEERRTYKRGETINIRRPSTFTAQNAPSSSQDVDTETVTITLNQWKEVKFELTDKELAFTTERIIQEHIRPAAVALADNVDAALAALYKGIPWYHTLGSTPAVSDITATRRILFDNKVPMTAGDLFVMVNGKLESELLNLSAFTQHQGAGPIGVNSQITGFLGQRYGMGFYANQNVQAHTAGAIAGATAPKIDGGGSAVAAGTSTITVDDTTLTGTVAVGDILTISGLTQKFVITAAATASGNAVSCAISPALPSAVADNTAVTFVQQTTTGENLAYHRNAFALVLAPLPTIGDGAGARIATVTDPITGLSIRSRIFYDGNNSKVYVALDILYGIKVLDPNLACRMSDT